ncbi:helix-turn-helix transcriptional regulator [Erwiniaceae bacterium L1_54_6]|jgi:transcriptional regulator with XRE-family HTH domain|uniref:XRE family transcriptional regulator n=1 Tax=Pantoea cypripedii TaxID=55209 RepID=A0A6B9G2R9_PANCY|nr:helix-turn-helix transcriptional regulator [Pantoea cypripedii]MDF7658815.1 helix-turn-helix transcriptional regulator [Erwiniaceae bacterium L1_54_6]QGY31754.1 XRE family transcriptional regulator [Pantoea cypripedii]
MLPGMQAIGATCRERRKARGWTQQVAASRAGIHRTLVSEIENGAYTGSLKALTIYLTAMDLMLTVQTAGLPQLDELEALFDDD